METARELIQTASREVVERTICERLAASDLYQCAWIGERELDGDRIVSRATAGEESATQMAVANGEDGSGLGHRVAEDALATGEVQVADVGGVTPASSPDALDDHETASVAAVPLYNEETVYGVLIVHSRREDAFRKRERAEFDVLGRTVGSVIHAARSRELLFADSIVELEFGIGTDVSTFAGLAAALGCEIILDGYVASGEWWIIYLAVDGGTTSDVVAAVADDPNIDRARVINDERGE